MHRMWNGKFYPILSVHRLWETPYIYVFSINVRRPMNVCVSSFCISRAFFRVCCFFGGVNVRCSLSYCFMFEYCKSQCISIGAYNSNMIEMIGLNIKRFSAHSISTFFASFFHFSKKKKCKEKNIGFLLCELTNINFQYFRNMGSNLSHYCSMCSIEM